MKVKRQPFGTFTAQLDNHPDNTPIFKVNVQFDSTWTEQALDNTGPQDNVYLAEFGGSLTVSDYVIIDRDPAAPSVGEVIRVVSQLDQQVQTLKVTNCGNPDLTVFEVNSVTGAVQVGNPAIPGSGLVLNSTLTLDGGCGTLNKIVFTADSTAGNNFVTNVVVTTANKTLADIAVGDYLKNITNESPQTVIHDTYITYVDTVNNKIWLSEPVGGAQAANTTYEAERNEKFVLNNGNDVTTFETDTCTGTTHIGNHYGRLDLVFASLGDGVTTYTNTAAIETAFDAGAIPLMYSFWFDPMVDTAGGPNTTVNGTATGSSGSVQVPVNSLGVGSGAFVVDDIVFVGTSTASATGIGDFIVGKVTNVITGANPTIVIEQAGDGLYTDKPFDPNNAVFASGNIVKRLIKHKEFANVIDSEERTRIKSGAASTYNSTIIDRGYIVQQKLDYLNWVVFADATGNSVFWCAVGGRLEGVVHQSVMNEQVRDGAIPFRTGGLHVSEDLRLLGGSIEIFDSVNQTRMFSFVNDDGHADHSGLMTWHAGVVSRGDFYLFKGGDPENVLLNPDNNTPSFFVDNLGNAGSEKSFTVSGEAATNPSTSFEQLSIQNLGPSGTKKFAIRQDNSISSFGVDNFYTATGGRHTRYLSSASLEADLQLIANIVYTVNVQSTSTLILTLPDAPVTGDVVRIVEVGGNLNYNTTLVLRTPESSGTPIQGDNTGTLFGDRITPYPSGELVVQTANAAFALIFLGPTDSNAQVGIPTSVLGWWLMEV